MSAYRYKILTGSDATEVEVQVKEYREKGYHCVGGVAIVYRGNDEITSYFTYAQAMEISPVQEQSS